jgi:hypothetical protein
VIVITLLYIYNEKEKDLVVVIAVN